MNMSDHSLLWWSSMPPCFNKKKKEEITGKNDETLHFPLKLVAILTMIESRNVFPMLCRKQYRKYSLSYSMYTDSKMRNIMEFDVHRTYTQVK